MEKAAKVLVVDDDPDFLDAMKDALTSDSCSVSVALNEPSALAQIDSGRPDLVILDVMMTDWNSGIRFMRELKGDNRYKSIPILMVTGVDNALHIDYARHAQAGKRTPEEEAYLPVAGYLVKPVAVGELRSKVRDILTGAGGKEAF